MGSTTIHLPHMNLAQPMVEESIAMISEEAWRSELEKTTYRYHLVAAWAAIIFDPVFSLTDYFNIPESWETLLYIRIAVSLITLGTVLAQRRYQFPSYIIVIVPFLLISLQNAFTYSLIGAEDLLGHNLNYMALLIGAAMFLAWEGFYSIGALVISALFTALFINLNPAIAINEFFVNGGLLLMVVGLFMYALIKTRYDLTIKEIKARLALKVSNEAIQQQNQEIQSQAERIKAINDNLERLVHERMLDLQRKNEALEEYAFINAHKLRSPVARILGLTNLVLKLELNDEGKTIINHLQKSTEELDFVVGTITKTIEKAD